MLSIFHQLSSNNPTRQGMIIIILYMREVYAQGQRKFCPKLIICDETRA